MIRDMEAERTIDEGTFLILKEEIIKGMESYLMARRAGKNNFEYRGSVLDLENGLEQLKREYFSHIAQLSSSFDRQKFNMARQEYLEFEEAIVEMEGRKL